MAVMRVNVVIKMKNAERLFIRKITSPKKKFALKEYFKGTPHRTLSAVRPLSIPEAITDIIAKPFLN
jgi:hypothetical protein